MKIKVKLSDGRVRLGQWDTNRYLTVEGVSSIWFKWDEASAVQGEIIENQVKIPDELLQKSGTLVVYAGLGTALEKVFYFTVTSAERPNDYVYTPTDILTWTELDRRISELENRPQEETDPTIPSWAKQPNKPTYTAEEVGALPASRGADIDANASEISTLKADMANKADTSDIPTDAHINDLIDAKLGVIENGTY